MHVIGTAGHVDHGKSTLIEALTGTHPDRLKEEQAREMTIELGFGWLTLPDGEEIGIVDVPGHRDFIENMLAGVGGIDAALLVIAADEGLMPQSLEHLAILDLLQIPAGIIVLSKTDLVSDPDWLDLVQSDVRTAVKGTVLQDAPIVRVSARTRSGLDQLTAAISEILRQRPVRADLGRPRLPIDRVFTMSGFGTVITGTLTDGHLSIGDEIQILPSGLTGRIRGLQTHNRKETIAMAGSRTAVNIAGLAKDQIERGEVLTWPAQYQASRRLDAHLRLIKQLAFPLQQGSEVKVFIGTSETMATVRLLDADELAPGQEGWIQLDLRNPVVAVRGDRYILRRPSPGETLGGGRIVDPQPRGRHKRFDENILKSLAFLALGSPSEVLLEAATVLQAAPVREFVMRSRLDKDQAAQALQELWNSHELLALEEGGPDPSSEALAISQVYWTELSSKVDGILRSYHEEYPLRRGMAREELKSRLKVSARVFNASIKKLSSLGSVIESGNTISQKDHTIRFDDLQQTKVESLMRRFMQNPSAPPTVKECQSEAGEELFNALVDMGQLISASNEVVFRKQEYDLMVVKIRQKIQEAGRISLAEVRDMFNTSRKYAQALLEHLDAIGETVREGDYRKLRK
jgi:selenocysteine-specific elongation factor